MLFIEREKMKLKQFGFAIMGLLFLAQTVTAKDNTVKANIINPMVIIETTTGKMIEQLQLKKQEIKNDPTIVMSIVEELLIPHFAANTISRKVLAKHARTITIENKDQFTSAFRFYMVRFYSKIFAEYTNQTFKYFQAPTYIGKKRVTVKTQLIQQGGKPIAIDYKMQRSGDSWKIIDLKIEGISMVLSNKRQFGKQISRDGIDTVIAKLEYKNQKAHTND